MRILTYSRLLSTMMGATDLAVTLARTIASHLNTRKEPAMSLIQRLWNRLLTSITPNLDDVLADLSEDEVLAQLAYGQDRPVPPQTSRMLLGETTITSTLRRAS